MPIGKRPKERIKLVNTLQVGEPKKGSKPKTSSAVDFSAKDVLNAVVSSLEDSKAVDTTTINIENKSALGDHMVVTSGTSHRHVGAIADHLIRELKAKGFGTAKVEGLPNCDWVLIDTGDVIVHIFRPEVREFYSIEKMWLMPDEETEQSTDVKGLN